MRQLPSPRRVSLSELPTSLSHIPKAPKQLFCCGELPPHDYKFVTFVGSRKATEYAKNITRKLIADMRGFPIVIVSGLAYGIDQCAHSAALEHTILTMAFPGSGLNEDVLYPAGHRQLANQIVATGGCLLSEFKNDQSAYPWTFPVRNRLMAGIADVVIIVEAREKSGSLITAREALDYGKTVLVVPGRIDDDHARGSNQLLYDGATPVLSANTILHELGFSVDATPAPRQHHAYTQQEQKIADLLYQPQTRTHLLQKTNLQMHELNVLLTEMEIKGYIKESGGCIQINS